MGQQQREKRSVGDIFGTLRRATTGTGIGVGGKTLTLSKDYYGVTTAVWPHVFLRRPTLPMLLLWAVGEIVLLVS